MRHEIPVIISFRWLERHDGNGDFLGYGCLLQITTDTPRRFILYRIVFDVSVRHSLSSYRLGLGALSGYFCHSVLGLWNLGEKRFPSSNNIPLFPPSWRMVFHFPRSWLVVTGDTYSQNFDVFLSILIFELLICTYMDGKWTILSMCGVWWHLFIFQQFFLIAKLVSPNEVGIFRSYFPIVMLIFIMAHVYIHVPTTHRWWHFAQAVNLRYDIWYGLAHPCAQFPVLSSYCFRVINLNHLVTGHGRTDGRKDVTKSEHRFGFSLVRSSIWIVTWRIGLRSGESGTNIHSLSNRI